MYVGGRPRDMAASSCKRARIELLPAAFCLYDDDTDDKILSSDDVRVKIIPHTL